MSNYGEVKKHGENCAHFSLPNTVSSKYGAHGENTIQALPNTVESVQTAMRLYCWLNFLQPCSSARILCTVDSISDAVHDNWHAAKCLTGMSAREHPVLCPPCCNLPAAIHSQQRENRAACLECCWIISDKSISNNLYKISWLGKNSKNWV